MRRITQISVLFFLFTLGICSGAQASLEAQYEACTRGCSSGEGFLPCIQGCQKIIAPLNECLMHCGVGNNSCTQNCMNM